MKVSDGLWADLFHEATESSREKFADSVEAHQKLAQMFQKLPYFFKIESLVQLMLQRPKTCGISLMKQLIIILIATTICTVQADDFERKVKPVLQQHCIKCHSRLTDHSVQYPQYSPTRQRPTRA